MLLKKRERSEKRTKLMHLFAAVMIIFHGFEKIESGHTSSSLFFFVAGAIFLVLALFHHKIAHKIRSADTIFMSIEGLLAVVIAVEYFNEHRHYLQYAYILAAAAYFVAAIIHFRNAPRHVS